MESKNILHRLPRAGGWLRPVLGEGELTHAIRHHAGWMNSRIYLAGPEVFLPNSRETGARKRAICERHGLVGVFPADEEDVVDPALPLGERALAISRSMERVMRGCDAMIVNLTPIPRTECRCRLGL